MARSPMTTRSDPSAVVGAPSIPLSVPLLHGDEWDEIKRCLDSGWVSSAGPLVRTFEERVAGEVGARHGVATDSGTAALHVALLAAGVGGDDEVLVPDLSFAATANAVRYAGGWPVFMDIEPDHWQIDVGKVADFLENGCRSVAGQLLDKATGRRVRAMLPVHLLGHPSDMDPLLELARRYGLAVVVDAAQALGATYRGTAIGRWGDAICLSFNGNKVVTAGGGGMVVTDDPAVAERARHLSTQARSDSVEFDHDAIGFNYRLSSLQAALGIAQLGWLASHVTAKRRIAESYRIGFSGMEGVRLPAEAPWAYSAWWLSTVLIDPTPGVDSRAVQRSLAESGIESRPLYRPLHQLPQFTGCVAHRVDVATRIHRDALSLPSSVGLSPGDQDRVVSSVRAACARG